MKNRKLRFVLIGVLVLLLIPTVAVVANSLPPPFHLYLRFFSSSQITPEVQAVQLAGCADMACQTPEYLVTYGNCDAPGCYPALPENQADWKLECAESRCLFESSMNDIGTYSPLLKVVTDIGDQAVISEPVANPDCQYCTIAWKIDLGQPIPVVTLDDDFNDPDKAYSSFLAAYIFAILIEALIGWIIFLVFSKKISFSLRTWLPAVLVANLLAYPISWLVIPSFGQFQAEMIRKTAIMVIVSVAVVTTIALILRWRKIPVKKGMMIALAIAVPVCVVLFMIGLLAVSYGSYTVHVAGLPWTTVVILAESFAVIFETIFIWLFLKKEQKLLWVAVFVIIMNASSLLLGLLVF